MANESVRVVPQPSVTIAGLQDLLGEKIISDDPERCCHATDNCLLPITSGIEAIGALMSCCPDESELPEGATQDLGYLLTFLAKASRDLQNMRGCAIYELGKKAKADGGDVNA
jgi:hypothetical protein